MPSVYGTDLFYHNNFTVPGGGPYNGVTGTPVADTSVVRPGDPASMLIQNVAASEYVEYALSPLPNLGWIAFALRIDTGNEPAGNTPLCQMWTVGFAVAAKLYWFPASNELSITVNDATFGNKAMTLDAWHWVEMIYLVNATTYSIDAQLDGSNFVQQTEAGHVSTQVQFLEVGEFFATMTVRYSHAMWGSANSTSDFLGATTAGFALPEGAYGFAGRGAGW